MKMAKTVLSGTMWMARGTATMVGLTVMLAVVLGAGTTALAAVPGDPFKLGQINTVNQATRLVGNNPFGAMLSVDNNAAGLAPTASPALSLSVEPGYAPMKVSEGAGKAANLDADKVDGKSAEQIGINGLERVKRSSAWNSDAQKDVSASCPRGKVVTGSGFNIQGGKTGSYPNVQTDISMDEVYVYESYVHALAYEEEPTTADWDVTVFAICATAP